MFDHHQVIVITGPTGIGKTALTEHLATRLPIEIVSADSRQIYRHLDIGTAKPPSDLLAQIQHHMIDILNPDQDYSAGQFGFQAREIIADIHSRDKVAVVAGGSGLYIRALLHGFFKHDVKDTELRARLEARVREEGNTALYQELVSLDAEAADKIHPNNTSRLIRALELCLLLGRPISEIQKENRDPAQFSWSQFGLIMERDQIYDRINRRAAKMFEDGLVAEVESLLKMGFDKSMNALNSVGYKETIAHIEGVYSLEKCIELTAQNTRRYAKRQLTWMGKEPGVQWISTHNYAHADELAETILKKVS